MPTDVTTTSVGISALGGRTAVVVPAAGRGERLGPGAPKALRHLAGEPLLVHAVRGLRACPDVDLIVVVAPVNEVAEVSDLLAAASLAAVVVAGGASRQESVRRGLSVLPDDVDVVLVHDAARALTPPSLVADVIAAVRRGASAVVPGVAVADTIKAVSDDVATATVDRSTLRAIQTPQGFSRRVLDAAYAAADDTAAATDDAGLVERLGGTITVVPGHDDAFKITRPHDLLLAQAVFAARNHHS